MIYPTASKDPRGRRLPNSWAIYVRRGDRDGRRLVEALPTLDAMIAERYGFVTGIYGDLGEPNGPELGVLIGHATEDRFANVALLDVASLGDALPSVLLTVTCLYDLGVRLVSYTLQGRTHPKGWSLGMDAIGRELGAEGPDQVIEALPGRVGLAHARRHFRPSS
jgi:hypothetical protein